VALFFAADFLVDFMGDVVVIELCPVDGAVVINPCWIKLLVTSLSKPFPRLSGTGLAERERAMVLTNAVQRTS
jgi:hypothetical protein